MKRFTLVRACYAATLAIALSACAPATMAPSDASLPDSSEDVVVPDASRQTLGDVPDTCVDVAGSWEWTGTCSVPGVRPDLHTCISQSGCTIRENLDWSLSVVGNVARRRLTLSSDQLEGEHTMTITGDTAVSEYTLTHPVRATCRITGRRGRFPGATSYCCEVNRASCGAGQRCVQVQANSDPSMLTTACVPNGTLPLGATCTRVMDRAGTDQCQGNNACASTGPSSTAPRVCAKLCSQETICGAGEVCRWSGQGPATGVCQPRCELLGSSCQPGATCRAYEGWFTGGGHNTDAVCEPAGRKSEGMACANSAECGDNLSCQWWNDRPTCRRVCDDTHACPSGSRCDQHPYGSPSNIGLCVAL